MVIVFLLSVILSYLCIYSAPPPLEGENPGLNLMQHRTIYSKLKGDIAMRELFD